MKRTNSRWSLFRVLILALCGVLAACQRPVPLDRPISARTPILFAIWRSEANPDLTSGEWQDFDVATQEIKFRITADHIATGGEAVDRAFREQIDGQSIRHVLDIGLRAKLGRLREERAEREKMIAENAKIATAPDDVDSINYLRALRERQAAQLKSNVEGINALEAKLREISAVPGSSSQ